MFFWTKSYSHSGILTKFSYNEEKNWRIDMIQTAIIAFILIGAMFLLTQCGDNDTKEVTKTEVDKDGIPKYVTEKSKDLSYLTRDEEMAMASYVEENKSSDGTPSLATHVETYTLATTENPNTTKTVYSERDEEMALASYRRDGGKEVASTEEVSADNKMDVVQADVHKVVTPVKEDSAVTAVSVVTAVTAVAVAIPEVNVTAVSEVETASKTVEGSSEDVVVPEVPTVPEANVALSNVNENVHPDANNSTQKIVVPEVPAAPEANVAVSNVNNSTQKIAIPTIPAVPEVNITIPTVVQAKSMEEFNSNSQVKKELRATKAELEAKISGLLSIAEEGTAKAEAEHHETVTKMQELILEKERLEANLAAEIEAEK